MAINLKSLSKPTGQRPIIATLFGEGGMGKTTLSVDSAGCRYLAEKEHRMWAKVADAFETKQGKIGIKVEVL